MKSENRSLIGIILHLISIYAYFSKQSQSKVILEEANKMPKNELLKLMGSLTKNVIEIFEKNPDKMIPVKTKEGIIKNITGFRLFHMVTDHFAYHRGQIVTIFKEITGKEALGTDFATFLLEDNPDFEL